MMLPPKISDITDRFLEEVDSRLPGRFTGLFLHGSICWGEFFAGSDIDFVGLWDELPTGSNLELLQAAHESTRKCYPAPTFDGFHCAVADLAESPARISHRPVFYQDAFSPEGTIDLNLVTWHELAERPVVLRGRVPPVYTNLDELIEFTRTNLDTYWRGFIPQMEEAGIQAVGEHDESVAWVGLGAARLHHLIVRGELTSKSGAGRYLCGFPDRRWRKIGREALRIREEPASPSLYDDLTSRGRDTYDLLKWLVEDGTRRSA